MALGRTRLRVRPKPRGGAGQLLTGKTFLRSFELFEIAEFSAHCPARKMTSVLNKVALPGNQVYVNDSCAIFMRNKGADHDV
jgi:hypothetical protein